MRVIFQPEPRNHDLSIAECLIHQLYLVVSLKHILLIDADKVHPEVGPSRVLSEIVQAPPKVRSDQMLLAIQINGFVGSPIAPRVGNGDVCWCNVSKKCFDGEA